MTTEMPQPDLQPCRGCKRGIGSAHKHRLCRRCLARAERAGGRSRRRPARQRRTQRYLLAAIAPTALLSQVERELRMTR